MLLDLEELIDSDDDGGNILVTFIFVPEFIVKSFNA